MSYTPVNIVKKISKKREDYIGMVTSLYTNNSKVRICPPNKKGERIVCVHNVDKVSKVDGYTYYSIRADKTFTVKDSLKNIIEDINCGWIRI